MVQTGEHHYVCRVQYSLEEVGEVSLAAAGPSHLHGVRLEDGRHDVQRGAHAPVAADLLRVVVHAETATITETNITFFRYGTLSTPKLADRDRRERQIVEIEFLLLLYNFLV